MTPSRHLSRIAIAALAATALSSVVALHAEAPEAGGNATTPEDYNSYTIGLIFGSQLQQAGFHGHLDLEALQRGVRAGLDGKAPSAEDRARIAQVLRGNREALAEENRARARAFLTTNASAKGVQTTTSGLQYEVLLPGDAHAASPGPTDRVTVRYRGRLLDGTEFDSSDRHGRSTSFTLDGVIRGWREALMLMKPGASWRLYVPPQLAYDANPPSAIPPGALLVFDIELLRVDPPPGIGPQPGAHTTVQPRTTTAPKGPAQ